MVQLRNSSTTIRTRYEARRARVRRKATFSTLTVKLRHQLQKNFVFPQIESIDSVMLQIEVGLKVMIGTSHYSIRFLRVINTVVPNEEPVIS